MKCKIWLPIITAVCVCGCGRSMDEAAMYDGGNTAAAPAADMAGRGGMDVSLAGSSSAEGGGGSSNGTPMLASTVSDPKLQQAAKTAAARRSVIKKGNLEVRVDNVEKAERAVLNFITNKGGYVETSQSMNLATEAPSLQMTIRIPANSFDETIVAFEKLGVRLNKRVSGEDVTAQLVDLGARLRIMRAQEDSYVTMLKKGRSMQDQISLQNEIMQLRSQIESLDAQRKSMSELAALSTLELVLTQSAVTTVAASTDPGWFQESWASATGAGANVLRILGTFGIYAIVFSPIWVGAVLLLRAGYRASRRPVVDQ